MNSCGKLGPKNLAACWIIRLALGIQDHHGVVGFTCQAQGDQVVLGHLGTIQDPDPPADDREKYGFYVPKPNEEIYGTWTNKEYSGILLVHPQKLVFCFWGYAEEYNNITDDKSSYQDTFSLVDKWTDSEGNLLYKVYMQNGQTKFGWFSLIKISKSGTVFEYIDTSYPMLWPTEADMNPDNPNYRIYYRQ